MTPTNRLLNILFLLLIFSCTKPSAPESNTQKDSTKRSLEQNYSEADNSASINEGALGDEDLTEDFDCVRGIPEPILDSNIYPNRIFQLNEDKVGIEKITLKNGDQLTITNDGCEYVMLSFEFITSRFHKDTSDLVYWSESAIHLFDDIKNHSSTSFDWNDGLNALRNYYKDKDPQKLVGEEIDFGGEDIRSFVSLDRIHQLNKKQYVVNLTFGVGPL